MSQLGRAALVGSLSTFGGSLMGFALRLGLNMVYARHIEASAYGAYALASVAASFVGLPFAASFSQSLVQLDAGHRGLFGTVWRLTVWQCLATVGIGLVALGVLFATHDDPRIAHCFLGLLGGQMLTAMAAVYENVLNRRLRYTAVAAIRFGGIVFSLAVATPFAFLSPGPFVLVLRDALPALLSLLVIVPMVMAGRYLEPGDRAYDKTTATAVLALGRAVFVNRALEIALARLDSLLLGAVLGEKPLGHYEQARYLAGLPNAAVAPFGQSVGLRTFAVVRDDPPRLARALALLQWAISRFLAVFSLAVIIAPDLAVRLVYGPGWDDAAMNLRLLALWLWLMPLMANQQMLLTALQTWWPIRIGYILGAATLALALVPVALTREAALVPLAQTAGIGVVFLVLQRAARAAVAVPRGIFWPPLAAAALASAAGLGLRALTPGLDVYPQAALAAALGVLVYIAALFALERKHMLGELRYLRDVLRRRSAA
ncbi:MAG: oligosaccharide flippase family protein [Myxococcota bacterium]